MPGSSQQVHISYLLVDEICTWIVAIIATRPARGGWACPIRTFPRKENAPMRLCLLLETSPAAVCRAR